MGRFGKTSKHAGKVQTANTGKSDMAQMANKHTTPPSQSIHPTKSHIKPSHPRVYRPNTDVTVNPNKYPERDANFGASFGVQTGNPVTHEVQQKQRQNSADAARFIRKTITNVAQPAQNLLNLGMQLAPEDRGEMNQVVDKYQQEGSVQAGLNAQTHKDKYGNIIKKKDKNKYQNISSEQEFNPFGL